MIRIIILHILLISNCFALVSRDINVENNLTLEHPTTPDSNVIFNANDGFNSFGIEKQGISGFMSFMQNATNPQIIFGSNSASGTNNLYLDVNNEGTMRIQTLNGTGKGGGIVASHGSFIRPASDYVVSGSDLGTSTFRWKKLFVNEIISSSTDPTELPTIDLLNESVITVTTVSAPLMFEKVMTENSPTVLSASTSGIVTITEGGLHYFRIGFNLENTVGSPKEITFSLILNSTIEVASVTEEIKGLSLDSSDLTGTFTLPPNSTLEVKVVADGAGVELAPNTRLISYKMQGTKGLNGEDGAKGEKGDNGLGATVAVEDEGVGLTTPIDTFNFVGGGVTVTLVGPSEANVNVPSPDAVSFDEAIDSITTDSGGTWVDRTLTGFEDKVILVLIANTSSQSRVVGVRENGSSLTRSLTKSKNTSATFLVQADGSGVIEIFADGTGVTFTNLGGFQ